VDPESAVKKQIGRYRQMSGEQRLLTALGLHQLACELARVGIRLQWPKAGPAEVERRLRERIAMAHDAICLAGQATHENAAACWATQKAARSSTAAARAEAPSMTENEFLQECLRRLNRIAVDYMLTGSMASNFWGMPRLTHDVDFVIHLKPDQVDELARAFEPDFFIERRSIQAAFEPPYQFNAVHIDSAFKVDFWLLRDEPYERTSFARRVGVTLLGEPAWIATAEDVILHKLLWHKLTPSERQLGDAAGVLAVQADRLDRQYLQRWAERLDIAELLADLLRGKIGPKKS